MSDYISQTITVSSCQSDILGGGGGGWPTHIRGGLITGGVPMAGETVGAALVWSVQTVTRRALPPRGSRGIH